MKTIFATQNQNFVEFVPQEGTKISCGHSGFDFGPSGDKNLFCPSDLEFLLLTAKNVEFLSLTLKNLEFLSLDSNFVLRLVTKTQGFLTFVTKTHHFLPFVTKTQGLRDKTNSYPPSGPKSKPS